MEETKMKARMDDVGTLCVKMKDPEQYYDPETWMWCLHCDKFFQVKDMKLVALGNGKRERQKCPFCGAAGIGIDLRKWDWPKEDHDFFPNHWPRSVQEITRGMIRTPYENEMERRMEIEKKHGEVQEQEDDEILPVEKEMKIVHRFKSDPKDALVTVGELVDGLSKVSRDTKIVFIAGGSAHRIPVMLGDPEEDGVVFLLTAGLIGGPYGTSEDDDEDCDCESCEYRDDCDFSTDSEDGGADHECPVDRH